MDKNDRLHGSGIGVGYVSVMLIFAVICLTVFAVMSFRAASANDGFNVRSGDYLKEYYAADSAAKSRLAELDGIAKSAAESGFFEDEFEVAAGALEGVALNRIMNGFSVNWSVKINERQALLAEASFTNDGNFEITRWQTQTISTEDSSDSHIGVWDGSF